MHNVSIQEGVTELAYFGDTPWHSLGNPFHRLMTTDEAIVAAHMQWEVELRKMQYPQVTSSGTEMEREIWRTVPNYRVIVREDTNTVLGVVTQRYAPIQNQDVANTMDAIITEGGAQIEVAGVLGQGERCWLLAQIPQHFDVVPGDTVRNFILFSWGHDGKTSLSMTNTPIRVVCQNTLDMAIGALGRKADISIRHSANASVRIKEAQTALGLVHKQIAEVAEVYQIMANTRIDVWQAEEFFKRLFPKPTDEQIEKAVRGGIMERWEERQTDLVNLYRSGKGVQFAPSTVWNAYNAVTDYMDHIYPILQSGETSEKRQESVLFGSYKREKGRALKEALAMVPAFRD